MKIGAVEVTIGDNDVISWVGPLAVDADGSPFAYAPAGIHHLDDLANAKTRAGEWCGVLTDDDGRPIVQCSTDPNPGGYVSTTALSDHTKAETDPTRYVDAGTVPFISVPRELTHEGVKLGDVCWVNNQANGRTSPAIVADIGPHGKIGEGSIALCIALGLSGDPRHGGTEHPHIAVKIYAGSTRGWPRTQEDIAAQLSELFRTT